jgi:hypothetical protein
MEHRPDTAAGSVAPAGCSKWNVKEETRDGSKTTVKREDFTTEPFFHADPLFRMSRISTARRSVICVTSGESNEASIFCNGSYWEEYFSQGRYCPNPACGTFPDPGFGIKR